MRGLTMTEYLDTLSPGDPVQIKDTSNDRIRDGAVRKVHGVKGQVRGVDVYVTRFKTVFILNKDGMTNLGRFVLVVP